MSLIHSMWLWGLVALVVPIAIHLLSRKEGKVIHIGSLRHLHESDAARFSSIRLNEIILLMLRSLVVMLLVLILAGLNIIRFPTTSHKWVIVEKGVNLTTLSTVIDSLKRSGFELRYLAKDFPTDSGNIKPFTNYWLAAEDLQAKNIQSAVIFSFNHARKFTGERIGLPSNIRWVSVPPVSKTFVVKNTVTGLDSITIRKGITSSGSTRFIARHTQELSESADVLNQEPIKVAIYYDPDFAPDARIIHASLNAISAYSHLDVSVSLHDSKSFANTKSDWVFWLSVRKPPLFENRSVGFRKCALKNMTLLESAVVAETACDAVDKLDYVITKRLNEDVALSGGLVLALGNILTNGTAIRMREHPDQRSLPDPLAWSKEIITTTDDKAKISAEPILYILLLLSLTIERWLAFRRNQ